VNYLLLEGFSEKEIVTFDPKEHDIDEDASSFLIKLKLVLENSSQIADVLREERFIDDMMRELLRATKYDDAKHLVMIPCSLKLVVGDRTFSAEADREGRLGLKIIWIMQENKHVDDTRYSKGDVQLVSCMIAACQTNYRRLDELYPEKMMGIKIKGDEIHFYSIQMKEEYLRQLYRGVPKVEIGINKYPPKRGLRLSNPRERGETIHHLWTMRNYALTLNNIF